jgi:hypothetical protein
MPCAHELCECPEVTVRSGDARYCSVLCASPEASGWSECKCGHAECKSKRRAAPQDVGGRRVGKQAKP